MAFDTNSPGKSVGPEHSTASCLHLAAPHSRIPETALPGLFQAQENRVILGRPSMDINGRIVQDSQDDPSAGLLHTPWSRVPEQSSELG